MIYVNVSPIIGKYVKINSGNCETHGMINVRNKAECEQAARQLYLEGTFAYVNQITDRPFGCIYASDDTLIWNTSPLTPPDCGSMEGSWTFDCICLGVGKFSC